MERNRGRILVIRGGAIGDFILTLPVFAALRRTFPETRVEALAYPKLAELAKTGGLVDGFRSIDARPLAGFFARGGKLDPDLASFFESFALVFSYLYDPDAIFKTNVALCSKAQFIQGPHRPDESQSLHATDVFLQPLEKMAIFDADPVPRLDLSHSHSHRSRDWLAVHPGSGSSKKNWPVENWIALLRRVFAGTDWNVLLVGGEAEEDRIQQLSRALPQDRIQVAFNRPLAELAGTLQVARFFVGHDSGITHLSAALGIPVLALWGETREEIWRPRHPQARVLKANEGLRNLSVERVAEELLSKLAG